MYYFVFEQPKNNQISRIHDQIRDIVEDLRISQEIVKANPVQTIESLALEGMNKKYSTIVVVGNDQTINKVASVVVQDPKVVLGIVPTDPESTLYELLGIKNWQEACRALARRKNLTIDLGLINKQFFFLTQVFLQPGWTKEGYRRKNAKFKIDFGDFSLGLDINEVVVANALLSLKNQQVIKKSLGDGMLDLIIPTKPKAKSFFANLFGSKKEEEEKPVYSIFHSNNFTITADDSVPVLTGNDLVTKTPATFQIAENALRIIVAKQL